jgi:hypothetical protein
MAAASTVASFAPVLATWTCQISLNHDLFAAEVRYWSEKFGVSQDRLGAAAHKVG